MTGGSRGDAAVAGRRRLGWPALAGCLLAGCAHFPLAPPLADHLPEAGYRFEPAPAALGDELVVLLAISGGGSRAAAFAYGVLEEMRRIELGGAETPAGGPRLLDELDVVSAVSGGSILAASYALHGERLFEEFLPGFLERDVQRALTRRLLAPGNWVRLVSPNFDRIDLMAEYFDEKLFGGATFADLEGRRPFVLVSATDMTRGVPFEFTQERFDALCADLSGFPLGRAVAASAAVPLVLTEVTLENYGWAACGFSGEGSADRVRSFRDPERRPWVHLQDGGLAGNLGLRSLVDVVMRLDGGCDEPRLDPGGRRVVMIVIDAVGDLDRSPERRKQGLSLPQTVLAAINVPIDEASARGLQLLPNYLDRWLERADVCAGRSETPSRRSQRVYPIVLDFEAVTAFDPEAAARLRLLPARFRLDPEDLALLRRTGAESLRRAPELRRLLADLGGP